MEQDSGHLESLSILELMIDFCTEEADLILQNKEKSENIGLLFLRKHLQNFMVLTLALQVETQQEESLTSLVHQAKSFGKTTSFRGKLQLMTISIECSQHSMQEVCL